MKTADPKAPKKTARLYGDDAVIAKALRIAEARVADHVSGELINDPNQLRQYAQLLYATLDPSREHFTVISLNARHRRVGTDTLFSGCTDGAEVHPSVIVRTVLGYPTACAVILVHNHPSGNLEPSASDHALTVRLKQALALIDIRVLDHLIIHGSKSNSFAEKGWL